MKTTVISHFFNEEYLLPYWLEHHKRIFDHGILIDYNSTDNSSNIIKDICPTWDIIPSSNSDFNARDCDNEVMAIERGLSGYRIALNVTEFLIGDINKLITNGSSQYLIPSYAMVDSILDEFSPLEFPEESLVAQRQFGIDFAKDPAFFDIRKARSFHNIPVGYSTGRHFNSYNTTDATILWYGFSPFTEELISRKLQIQTRIPDHDKEKLLGREHIVTRDGLILMFRHYQQYAEDLSYKIMPQFELSWNLRD